MNSLERHRLTVWVLAFAVSIAFYWGLVKLILWLAKG